MKSPDITGKRFGRLTATRLEYVRKTQNGTIKTYWLFRCDCGKEKVAQKHSVERGSTRSCGCLFREHNERQRGILPPKPAHQLPPKPVHRTNSVLVGLIPDQAFQRTTPPGRIVEMRHTDIAPLAVRVTPRAGIGAVSLSLNGI